MAVVGDISANWLKFVVLMAHALVLKIVACPHCEVESFFSLFTTFLSVFVLLAVCDLQSGEKSRTKHKQRRHKDKSEEGADTEKKERRTSRHKEGEEGKDRKKFRDDEGDKKKKRRSKHSRAKSEEGGHEGEADVEL